MSNGRGKAPRVLIEVCVDSVESALAAQQGGGDRVELCSNLAEGGTTPSAGMTALAVARLRIPLHVMIRPRGGDFCYSRTEFEVMKRDIVSAGRTGAGGVVFGILEPDGRIDRGRTAELIAVAGKLSVTFHRAFDMTRDPFEALETLKSLGVERVLTSGQQASALSGLRLIRELNRRSEGRVIVMPGGGVERAPARVVRETGVREIHVVGTVTRKSSMRFRNRTVFMGDPRLQNEYRTEWTDPGKVRSIRTKVRRRGVR